LHAIVSQYARHSPQILAAREVSHALEQSLIEAAVRCFCSEAGDAEPPLAFQQRALVMRRFEHLIEANLDRPLYLPEVCAAIRTSERTLRAACNDHLGMGPKRYLLGRRMELARRALGQAIPGATVADAATRFGFWHLGRFSTEYRLLFGETPSRTLARARSGR
jgi:AraC-like DNA-binding protein